LHLVPGCRERLEKYGVLRISHRAISERFPILLRRFLVQQPKEALDQKACVSPQPGEEKQAKTKVIHDLTFTVFHAEKSLEGRDEQWEIYRTYHRDACYALVVRKGWTGAASSGSKGEKKFDEQIYHAFGKDLAEPVNTFEFLM
jgi:hypothetical protein